MLCKGKKDISPYLGFFFFLLVFISPKQSFLSFKNFENHSKNEFIGLIFYICCAISFKSVNLQTNH